MPDIFTTQNIIEGGGVLVALTALWIIRTLVTNHDAHLLKALDKNTDAWIQNAKALTKLTDKLER